MTVFLAALVAGLFGTVTRAPTMPVCIVGQPCSKPAAGVTLTFMHGGVTAKSVVTGANGTYRVLLAPGVYTVRVSGLGRMQRMTPTTVTVRRGLVARQAFVIDTGIR
jgi:hypothetical protein